MSTSTATGDRFAHGGRQERVAQRRSSRSSAARVVVGAGQGVDVDQGGAAVPALDPGVERGAPAGLRRRLGGHRPAQRAARTPPGRASSRTSADADRCAGSSTSPDGVRARSRSASSRSASTSHGCAAARSAPAVAGGDVGVGDAPASSAPCDGVADRLDAHARGRGVLDVRAAGRPGLGAERVGRPGRREHQRRRAGSSRSSSGAVVPAAGLDEPGLGELGEEQRDLADAACRRPTTPR